ncbi:MAG: rhodanese-like domain-containing protein [Bacteroidota bacterium]
MIEVPAIDFPILESWRQEERPHLLIDVREDWERDAFHIGGEWYPMEQFIRETPDLPTDRPVVVYCQKGIRSAICIQRLAPRFPEVQFINLQKGVAYLQQS